MKDIKCLMTYMIMTLCCVVFVMSCGKTVVSVPKIAQEQLPSSENAIVGGECKEGDKKPDTDGCNTCQCAKSSDGKLQWACTLLACETKKDPGTTEAPQVNQPPALPKVDIPTTNEKLVQAFKESKYQDVYDMCSKNFKDNNPYDVWSQTTKSKIGNYVRYIGKADTTQVVIQNPDASATLDILLMTTKKSLNLKYKNEDGVWKVESGLNF